MRVAVVTSEGPVVLRTSRRKPSTATSSATSLSAGARVPLASGTVTAVSDLSPEIEIDEPPSCAAGSVKVGAAESGAAGFGAAVALGEEPTLGEAPGSAGGVAPGVGMTGIAGGGAGAVLGEGLG